MMGTAPGAKAILAAAPYFARLRDDTLDAVAQATTRAGYSAGQIVLAEGQSVAGLHLVETGWLKVVKYASSGREQIMRFVGPQESFDEFSVFLGSPNPATVIALEPCVLWVVQREALLRLLDEHPDLSRAVIEVLARRAQYLAGLVEDLALRTVEARLARFLLQEAPNGVLHRRRWATQAEMAARLGTVLDVFNRAVRSLVEEGLIAVDRQKIEILDRDRLADRAATED